MLPAERRVIFSGIDALVSCRRRNFYYALEVAHSPVAGAMGPVAYLLRIRTSLSQRV